MLGESRRISTGNLERSGGDSENSRPTETPLGSQSHRPGSPFLPIFAHAWPKGRPFTSGKAIPNLHLALSVAHAGTPCTGHRRTLVTSPMNCPLTHAFTLRGKKRDYEYALFSVSSPQLPSPHEGEVLTPSRLTVPRKIVPGHAHSLEERISWSSSDGAGFVPGFRVSTLEIWMLLGPADRVRAALSPLLAHNAASTAAQTVISPVLSLALRLISRPGMTGAMYAKIREKW